MSEPCPPVPELALQRGVAPCEYIQLSPRDRREFARRSNTQYRPQFSPYFKNNSYSIGGYPMHNSHHIGATPRVYGAHGHMGSTPRVYGHIGSTPRVYGMHHLGRSILNVSKAKEYNRGAAAGQKGVRPSSVGSYGSMESNAFIDDLWTAQLLALWVTNGNAFPEMGMSGVVTANGHSPSNVAPLGIGANGVATTDVKRLFTKTLGSNTSALKGPDGMFGKAADSIITEWAGTGKLFGSSVPAGNAQIALNKLASQVTTPAIQNARDKKAAGIVVPSKESAAPTPCNELTAAARASRSDCPSTGGGSTGGGTPRRRTTPKRDTGDTTAAEGETPWLLYGGIGAAVLVAGGIGYYIYSQRSSSEV